MEGKRICDLSVGDSAEKENLITQENAEHYAAVTGDNNPIHFETEEAYHSRYGRPIAHGMILAGFISGVIGSYLPGFGCIYEKQTLNFARPVFYGDMILTRVTVDSIQVENGRVVLRTECFNQKQELVLYGQAVVLPKK